MLPLSQESYVYGKLSDIWTTSVKVISYCVVSTLFLIILIVTGIDAFEYDKLNVIVAENAV